VSVLSDARTLRQLIPLHLLIWNDDLLMSPEISNE
jgi:hypothetical protein